MIMKPKTIILIAMLSCLVASASAINITAENVTDHYIKWSWDPGLSLTGISIDGKVISGFDPAGNSYILSNLNSNELHQITVYTAGDSASLTTQTKEGDNTWGWVALTIVFFLLGVWLHWAFFFFGSGVAAYGLASWLLETPNQAADIWHLPFFLFGFMFVLGFVLWAFRKRGRR